MTLARRTAAMDRAASSVLGTITLIAVSVGIVAAGAASIVTADVVQDTAPAAVAVGAKGAAGAARLELVHHGGAPLAKEHLRALLFVDGDLWYDGPVADPRGLWTMGDTVHLDLPDKLPPGARAEVSLVDARRGEALLSTSLDLPRAAPAASAPGPALVSPLGAAGLNLSVGSEFQLEVDASHGEGRKHLRYVYADLSALGGPAWVELRDDGTAGDVAASDGLYGARLTVPTLAPSGAGRIALHAVDLDGTRVTLDLPVNVVGLPPLPPPPPLAPAALPTPPGPSFTILPTGAVRLDSGGPVEVSVVGVSITYGLNGPAIPVRASITKDGGGNLTPLNGGGPVAAGQKVKLPDAPPGAHVGVYGHARHVVDGVVKFDAGYYSYQNDPHVRVLRHNDSVPAVAGFGSQASVASFLRPFVNTTTQKVTLPANQVIVLYEFNPTLTVAAADYQDLVLLLDFGTPPPPPPPVVLDPGFAYEDVDDDRLYDVGLDRPIPNASIRTGIHITAPGAGLVIPASVGPIVSGDKVEFKTSQKGNITIGVALTAQKEVRIEAAGTLYVPSVQLRSTTDKIELETRAGPLHASGATLDAQKELKIKSVGTVDIAGASLLVAKGHAKIEVPHFGRILAGGAIIADENAVAKVDGYFVQIVGTPAAGALNVHG